jgi:Domain of unknown function (DUF4836)
MLKRTMPVIIMSAILFFLASCGQKKQVEITHMIPAGASNVLAINIDLIGQKMDFNTLAKENEESFGRIRMLMSFMGIPDVLEDRSITGVDFKSPIYVYYDFDRKEGMDFNALLTLEDAEKFEAFLDKLKPTEKTEENGITSINLNIGNVSWKDNIAWISMGGDNEGDEMNPFLISTDNSIAGTTFGELIANTDVSDVIMWTNPMSKIGELKELAPGLNAENFLDYTATMALNFEKGKIVCDYQINTRGETSKNFDKLVGKGINEDLLTGLDESEIPGILSFAVNPKIIRQIFLNSGFEDAILNFDDEDDDNDEAEAKEKAEKAMATLNVMARALRGDVVIALKGFEKNNDSSSMQPSFYIAAGIQERKPIDSLLKKWVSDTVLLAKEGYFETAKPDNKFFVVVEESKFYLLNSTSDRNALMNNQIRSGVNNALKQNVTGMPSYIKVDFELLSEYLNELIQTKGGNMGMLSGGLMSVFDAFDELEMTSGKKGTDTYSASFVLTMKDKDQNSMANILKRMMDLGSSFGM